MDKPDEQGMENITKWTPSVGRNCLWNFGINILTASE